MKSSYQLRTDPDFFYAIATEKEVSILSADFIGSGTVTLFNEHVVLIGEQYFMRESNKFYVQTK